MTNAYEAEGPLPAACARLDRELADFLDGTLPADRSDWVAEHLSECARCATVLESLGEPSEAGRAMAALPGFEAPAHLWAGVSERIAAPVVEIGRGAGRAARDEGRRRGWLRSGLAAAGLVIATAGVTYTLTARQQQRSTSAVASTQPQPAASTPVPTPVPTPTQVATTVDSTPPASAVDAGTAPTRPPVSTVSTVSTVANTGRTLGARRARLALPADPARETYDREIAKLRVVLQQRRGDLDTSTVRVVTQSLKVIDQAIAQSKAALARDPASGFLNKQLNNALDQKLELLRTAALLPART